MTPISQRRRRTRLALLIVSLVVLCGGGRAGVSTAQPPQMPLPRSLEGATVEADSPRPQDLPAVGAWAAILEEGSWYRYQGEPNSGPYAHSNCGPTCVAMAVEFAQDGRWVAIRDIRSYIGGTSWTYPSQLQSALEKWGVPHARLNSMPAIHDAVAVRRSIVILHLWMNWFTPGSDYLVAYSDPALHHGRYYAYSQSHWVVFHGLTGDGVWAICHDPNVWEGDGRYWYAGNRPKGENRYYRYSELAASAADYGYQAIEVFAPAPPSATPTLTLAAPTLTSTPIVQPTSMVSKRVDLPLVHKPAPPTPTTTPTETPTPPPSMTPPATAPTVPAPPTATPSATLVPTVPLRRDPSGAP